MSRRDTNIKQAEDRELVLLYQETDDQAIIGELYERYAHLVYGVCLKYLKNQMDSQDAVVKIFEKLMTDLRTNDVQVFKGWLHTVSRNHCLMYLRKHNKDKYRHKDIEAVEHSLQQEEDDSKIEIEWKLEQLEAAITELKPEQKQCIELFYIKDKCYQDVADTTGYTLKQVKSFIQNGKRNLKQLLVKSNVTSLD